MMKWWKSPISRRPSPPSRQKTAASLLTAAQIGHAHWFFGNLYETIARIPQRMANAPDLAAEGEPVTLKVMLRPGSPVRYYLPAAPATAAATIAALVAGWPDPRDRRWLALSLACTVSGGLITGHIVKNVNLRLFFDGRTPPAEVDRLLRTWYRLNAIRLVAAGGAWLAAQRVASGAARRAGEN
jgi:hypothetical protein